MHCLKRLQDALILPKIYTSLLAITLALLSVLVTGSKAYALSTWEYTISPADTANCIDTAKTTAVVDTSNHEIRLPKYTPKVAAMWGDNYLDYLVMTPDKLIHYSFDGTEMVENPVVSVPNLSNPVAAFISGDYPDVIVAQKDKVIHYSFTGTAMAENPALTVSGLTNIVSVGSRCLDTGILADGKLEYYAFDGTGMVKVPALSIEAGLTNPIDFALFPDNYDAVVLEKNQARYYNAGTENPALAITGLIDPKSIAAADGGNVAIVDGTEVRHYTFTGSEFAYNAALSITSGLTRPTCIALRPGTFDRLVLDGDQVRYYMWDGAGLVLNDTLSVTVADLQNMGGYGSSAVAQSTMKNLGNEVGFVRVRAYCILPKGTSITWAVTANGTDWTTRWRATGLDGGMTSLEVSDDNGATWSHIGDASKAWPTENTFDLWAEVAPGQSVGWKATLASTDPNVTPKIKAPVPGSTAVIWEAGNRPKKPVIPEQGSCYTTSIPMFTWTFEDADAGDTQAGYEAKVLKLDGTPVYESGTVNSADTSFRIPTSTDPATPGPLWAAGEYQFQLQVRVFDSSGIPSEWSDPADFCVVAFERPRIRELVYPAAGQIKPVPDDPATHLLVTEGMLVDQLPRTAAGGKVGVLVDSIGPVDAMTARFPYLSQESTIGPGTPAVLATNGGNKQWLVEFWTDANLQTCPNGTVVKANFAGTGAEGATNLALPPYAAGIVTTNGSAYEHWFVVLQGRKR